MSQPLRSILAALAVLLAACAGTPGPGDPGYPFNVAGEYTGRISLEGMTITARMTLQTGAGGIVTGQVRVPEMGITADVEGTLEGDRFSLRIPYFNPSSQCQGVAESDATVGDGGASISGPMTATECGQSMVGSLDFRR